MNFKGIIGAVLFLMVNTGFAQNYDFEYEYVGKILEKENMHIWGASPIMGPDGKVHLYVAQWPLKTQSNFSGWYKDSEIGHYVADKPEGPFKYVGVAVPDLDTHFNAPHNPSIRFLNGQYVLTFIVNTDSKLKSQRVVMYVADDLSDNWRPAKGGEADGTILHKSNDKSAWNYHARLGVSNPSLIEKDGQFLFYVKSVIQKDPSKKWGAYTYGVAVSDKLEGPYTYSEKPVTRGGIEDTFAFTFNDKVYMLSRDFGSLKGSHGGGLIWRSDDGLFFPEENITRAFEALEHYVGKPALADSKVYRGKISGRLERPQILFVDGKPAYVYLATGINDTENHGSASHLFKMTPRKVK